ncbi:hypothetical protein [Burkholderia plantarii]|uniref:hypothetical protein n=1 Tax=Burkholderia plantarii TaxID=41899 RepID=UPI00114CB206|nr:hypothetical protein [Burkholderia plantarii]
MQHSKPCPDLNSLRAIEDSKIYWTSDSYRELYGDLIEMMKSVIETNQIPFTFDSSDNPRRTQGDKDGRKHLAGFLPKFDLYMDLAFPGYHYSPDFRLFFDVLSKHRLGKWRKGEASRTVAAMRLQAPLYNQFITDLRIEGKRRNVSKQLLDWKEGLSRQEESIRKFVVELRATKKRLIPLRVDFYYGASAAVEEDAMPRICWGACSKERHLDDRFDARGWTGAFEVRGRIDSARAMQDRARLFENQNGVDRELFDAMMTYVCKLEVGGRYRANHFHVLFLFDAAHIHSHNLDRMLFLAEDRWYRVTGGLGMVFDSRNRRDVHELRERGRWALDPIDCSNDEQLAALEKHVLSYFTKDKGQLLRIKPTPKANTLTTGQVGR